MGRASCVWLIARKDLMHLRRDRRAQALTLVLPIVAMAAFAFSFGGQNFTVSSDSEPYPLVVQDLDHTTESRQFIEILQATHLFALHIVPDERDASAYMADSGAFASLAIPSGFAAGYRDGTPRLDMQYDNTRPYVGALTVQRVKLVLEAIALQQGQGVAYDFTTLTESGGSLDIFTPGIVILLVAFTSLNDIATSLTRERTEGTLGRIFLAPVPTTTFLAGKVLAGLILALARAALIVGLAVFVLGIRFHGSLAAFSLVILLTAFTTLCMGVVIAARARSDREVMVATLMVTILLMFMMGAITPIELMSAPARTVAHLIPHTYATQALRSIMLLGSPASSLWAPLAALCASAAALAGAGIALFRRSLS